MLRLAPIDLHYVQLVFNLKEFNSVLGCVLIKTYLDTEHRPRNPRILENVSPYMSPLCENLQLCLVQL